MGRKIHLKVAGTKAVIYKITLINIGEEAVHLGL